MCYDDSVEKAPKTVSRENVHDIHENKKKLLLLTFECEQNGAGLEVQTIPTDIDARCVTVRTAETDW